jgi:hypothetical protein
MQGAEPAQLSGVEVAVDDRHEISTSLRLGCNAPMLAGADDVEAFDPAGNHAVQPSK